MVLEIIGIYTLPIRLGTVSDKIRPLGLHLPDTPGIESLYNSDVKAGKIEKKTNQAMMRPNIIMLFL